MILYLDKKNRKLQEHLKKKTVDIKKSTEKFVRKLICRNIRPYTRSQPAQYFVESFPSVECHFWLRHFGHRKCYPRESSSPAPRMPFGRLCYSLRMSRRKVLVAAWQTSCPALGPLCAPSAGQFYCRQSFSLCFYSC